MQRRKRDMLYAAFEPSQSGMTGTATPIGRHVIASLKKRGQETKSIRRGKEKMFRKGAEGCGVKLLS